MSNDLNNEQVLALAAKYSGLNADTWQAATTAIFNMQNLLSFVTALRAADRATLPAQASSAPDELRYATNLARAIWQKHYSADVPQWKVLPDLYGALSQIDNMVTGLTRASSAPAVATGGAVAWAVVSKKGGIHKLSITRESAERKAAHWQKEWPDNGCTVRPLAFMDAAPTAEEATAKQAATVPNGWISVKEILPWPSERVLVTRFAGRVSNPSHPGYPDLPWVEVTRYRGDVAMFECDIVSAGSVTHWKSCAAATTDGEGES